MEEAPTDRYVFLTSRYGGTTVYATSEDADVADRMIPLYDAGTLHDVGCIVREVGDGGRHGLLASEAMDDEHEVPPYAVQAMSRRIGLEFMAFRYPDPAHAPQVAAFIPLDDPRLTSPWDVTAALSELCDLAMPRSDIAVMPLNTSKAGVHKVLKEALESASIEIIFHKRPLGTATDGGPMAAAWGLYADLRGTDVASAVRSIGGVDKPEWNEALAGNGIGAFAPSPITPERVAFVMDGLLVHAAAKEWSSSQLGKAWALAARIHEAPVLTVAEALIVEGDPREVLEANGCEFEEPSPSLGA